MSPAKDERLKFYSLYESPIVTVQDYTCQIGQGEYGAEEVSETNSIVLMRHGAFSRHFGKKTVTADVNQAVYFSKGSTYRVSHPADCGDRGTIFTISPRVLNDIVRELDPSIDEHPGEPFRFVTGPCTAEVFKRHRELVQRFQLASEQPLEPLWADVTALQLVADVLESAFIRKGSKRSSQRGDTKDDHAERVEKVRQYLTTNIGARVSLDEVAKVVHFSPFHLARIFQEHTGLPLHRYLTQLRLRVAQERLLESSADLTELALDLGFSSHSHFSDAFRREFGYPPSKARKRSEFKL